MTSEDPASSAPVPSPKKPRWRRWAVEIGVFLLVLLAIQWWQARDVPTGPAPAFEAQLADGGRTSLAAWRGAHPGGPTAIYFWADWCPICKAQEGSVDSVADDWPVLTVAMQSGEAETVSRVLAERGLDWPTVVDADGALASRYGLHGVPALVVLDADGDIRSVSLGYTTGFGLRARLWWAGLIS